MELAETLPATLVRVPLDPGRFWIRYTPRVWPSPDTRWVHLAAARPGPADMKAVGRFVEIVDRPDDVLYLPATREEFREDRDRLVLELVGSEVPILVQVLPGERVSSEVLAVLDLSPLLFELGAQDLPEAPLPALAVWPLVAGITDRPELVADLGPKLVDAGVRVITVMRLELDAREKRELAEGRSESVFEALFHRQPVQERRLAGTLASLGLQVFPPRPTAAGLPAFQLRRRLAGLLAEAAELDLRCARHGRGQELYRAARYLDESVIDILALHREGNLHVLGWLDAESRSIIESAISGVGDALEERRSAYLGIGSTSRQPAEKESE